MQIQLEVATPLSADLLLRLAVAAEFQQTLELQQIKTVVLAAAVLVLLASLAVQQHLVKVVLAERLFTLGQTMVLAVAVAFLLSVVMEQQLLLEMVALVQIGSHLVLSTQVAVAAVLTKLVHPEQVVQVAAAQVAQVALETKGLLEQQTQAAEAAAALGHPLLEVATVVPVLSLFDTLVLNVARVVL